MSEASFYYNDTLYEVSTQQAMRLPQYSSLLDTPSSEYCADQLATF